MNTTPQNTKRPSGPRPITPYALRTPGAIYRVETDPVTGRIARCLTTPQLVDVAELVIRQDMTIADEGCNMWRAGRDSPDTNEEDTKIVQWAVSVAGHLFDPHTLWDYDLITDADHVHRCLTHRHEGPNTRGLLRGTR